MRLFVALNLKDDERKKLYKAAAPLRKSGMPVRWVEQSSLHITLKFLGDVRAQNVDAVMHAVAEVAGKAVPHDVKLGGFGAFPTIRRPRIIWAGAEARPELRSLKHDLEWELAALGFERELRAFQPHITLGRADEEAEAGNFRDLETLIAEIKYKSRIPVRQVDLMSSKLTPDGAVYEVLGSAPVGVPEKRKAAG
ncbi:MAG TPA: RNA 2',3'-cyclic phosphodiesterase [Longimicrobiales bacterium]